MFTVKNDWVLQVQSDLEECGIFLTENEIAKMKRISYKKLVTEKNQSAFSPVSMFTKRTPFEVFLSSILKGNATIS